MFVYRRRGGTFALNVLHLEMKHRILAIVITFFFGIATYILMRSIGSEDAQADKGTIDRVVHPHVNQLLKPVKKF